MTPFYTLALQLFTRTQRSQIQKGIEKYPEPFNPRSWTPQELLNHALEETVDLTHYLVGLKTLLDDKDEEIERLKTELAFLKAQRPFPKTFASSEDWVRQQNFLDELTKKPKYMDLDDA